HSRPYHPQTCGKVERFHQTQKKYLAKQPAARSLEALQAQLDRFASSYNTERPHRALGRRTPQEVFEAKLKARPDAAPETHFRVRYDKVDHHGALTLRYDSKLHHIGMGARHRAGRW
ncbi:MAG TPA: integrase core domain-containing protein, partial [Candidatus Limnocylindria bacterium]|nr:integrase core domain-containing protein [Candidatus Limnocylindria bacterium]